VTSFCSLEGRTALVTGASRGIGRAIATELAGAGASVVLSFRTGAEEAESLATEIGARAVQADVSDPESARALVDDAGDLDILVNNAGVTRDGLLVRMSDEDWNTAIRANVVVPGYVKTQLTDVLPEEATGAMLENTPLGRLGDPEDVAGAVRFLCSDEAAFITGAVLLVDGGLGM
jgi:3-oxoacyl-[acyl-carrier protein] reductase